MIRSYYKLLLFIIIAVAFFLATLPLVIFFYCFPYRTRFYLNKITSFFSKLLLKFWDISVSFEGQTPKFSSLIAANHLSYLDVIVLASRLPCSFVTSKEIRETFFLGHICKLAGCVFVERRNKMNIGAEIKEIEETLTSGSSVLFFPEATSTNGESILPFKRSLFKAAINTITPVVPICINYISLDGEQVNLKNRDNVCWYGDMSFLPHLLKFLGHKKVEVMVSVLPALSSIQVSEEYLGSESRKLISQKFIPVSKSTKITLPPPLNKKVLFSIS